MTARLFPRYARLFLGSVLGALALGSTAHPAAAASPLDLLGPLGSVLSPRPTQPQPPANLDLLTDNVRNNNLNLCVLTCNLPNPAAIPGGAPQRVPAGAIPPQRVPAGAIPPTSRPPAAPPQATQSSARPTLTLPPIQF
jgi:hypothetical protein